MSPEQNNEQVTVVEHTDKVRNDPAFEVVEINTATGETTVVIQKGIVGALANQLKNSNNRRKGSSILRKLGYVLSDCGDVHYGNKKVDETDLDPELIVEE